MEGTVSAVVDCVVYVFDYALGRRGEERITGGMFVASAGV